MAVVVRIGPLPLGRRREVRVAELERLFGTPVELVEILDIADLAPAIAIAGVRAVVIDAAAADQLADAVRIAGPLPVLRPLWREVRNPRGEMDEVFDGYGLLTGRALDRLPDGALAVP